MELIVDDEYKVETYSYGFVLRKKCMGENRKGEVTEHWNDVGYYGNFQELKVGLLRRKISSDPSILSNIDRVIALEEKILSLKNTTGEKHD